MRNELLSHLSVNLSSSETPASKAPPGHQRDTTGTPERHHQRDTSATSARLHRETGETQAIHQRDTTSEAAQQRRHHRDHATETTPPRRHHRNTTHHRDTTIDRDDTNDTTPRHQRDISETCHNTPTPPSQGWKGMLLRLELYHSHFGKKTPMPR